MKEPPTSASDPSRDSEVASRGASAPRLPVGVRGVTLLLGSRGARRRWGVLALGLGGLGLACTRGPGEEPPQAATLTFPLPQSASDTRAAASPGDEPPQDEPARGPEPGTRTPAQRTGEAARAGSPPDPPPLVAQAQWAYVFAYDQGDLSVRSVEPLRLPAPRPTVRNMGRWAVELWVGQELVERVRFDFPMLAVEPVPTSGPKPLEEPPSLAPGANVSKRVLVPDSTRATRALVVDRATGETLPLAWPPAPPSAPE